MSSPVLASVIEFCKAESAKKSFGGEFVLHVHSDTILIQRDADAGTAAMVAGALFEEAKRVAGIFGRSAEFAITAYDRAHQPMGIHIFRPLPSKAQALQAMQADIAYIRRAIDDAYGAYLQEKKSSEMLRDRVAELESARVTLMDNLANSERLRCAKSARKPVKKGLRR